MKTLTNGTESFPLRGACPDLSGSKKGASILVTGSSGFIASRVCEMLPEKGEQVVGIDNIFALKPNNSFV